MLLTLAVICSIISGVGFYLIFTNKITVLVSAILPVCSIASIYSSRFPHAESFLFKIMRYMGGIYLGYLLYFPMCCVVVYVIHLIKPQLQYKKYLSYSVVAVTTILVYGYINALSPVVRELNLLGSADLKICFVSDVHIGGLHTSKTLNQLPNLINDQHPDIVIFGGDIIDYPALYEGKEEVIRSLRSIQSNYGTYAILGNHECYNNLAEVSEFFKKCGITLLADSYSIVNNQICILGRKDKGTSRQPLQKIYPNTQLPIIIVTHNPKSINESLKYAPFLNLAGHTHAGQMFPMNIIINMIYKHKTGELVKTGKTYSYI